VVRGDTLEELAASLDERLGKLADSARNIRLHEEFTASLRGTIERFNGFACKGVDNDFRRGETPIEITFHGPVAEDNPLPQRAHVSLGGARALLRDNPGARDARHQRRASREHSGPSTGADERPVPGCTQLATRLLRPQGQGYISGGMTFGPIITFSYLAANAAVHEPGSK